MLPAINQKQIRFDRQALVNELILAGAVEVRGQFKCPFHDDNNPSGSIYCGEDNVFRYKCHSTNCSFNSPGDIFDVQAKRTGRTTAQILQMDQMKKSPPIHKQTPLTLDNLKKKILNIESVFEYTNPDTNSIDLVVIRHAQDGKKSFKQIRPEGNGFVFGAPERPLPIYNRTRVLKADVVIVCEGEKCVHALHDIGIVATTSPGGAGKAKHADWSPLKGKECVLWPDYDEPGVKHMDDVQSILQAISSPPVVRRIDPSQLNIPAKGDCVEFLQNIQGSSETKGQVVLDLISDAERLSVSDGFYSLLDDICSGKHANIPFPWLVLTNLTRAMLPGSVCVLAGSPGAAKSFFLDSMLIHWIEENIKFACYKLEDDLPFHLNRLFAMKTGFSQYLNPGWIQSYPDEVKQQAEELRPFLDSIGRHITCIPKNGIDLPSLADWVERKAKEGNRIICIDPVTAASFSGNQWTADLEFMMKTKAVCRDYGASLILVTHPVKQRQNTGRVSMDDLSGGSAYQRFAHCILWITRHNNGAEKSVNVLDKNGDSFSYTINRTIHILKTRNAKGAGLNIGFVFDEDRLGFNEIGIIQPKQDAIAYHETEDDSQVSF